MIRVRRLSDNATGNAWQRTAPTTIREILVDALIPVGSDLTDFIIALDDGTWDVVAAAGFADAYVVTA